MGNAPADGRADVAIRSSTRGTLTAEDRLLVTHEAACRWCPESILSPDVRSVIQWADAHESSSSHDYVKKARIATHVGPQDPWAAVGV